MDSRIMAMVTEAMVGTGMAVAQWATEAHAAEDRGDEEGLASCLLRHRSCEQHMHKLSCLAEAVEKWEVTDDQIGTLLWLSEARPLPEVVRQSLVRRLVKPAVWDKVHAGFAVRDEHYSAWRVTMDNLAIVEAANKLAAEARVAAYNDAVTAENILVKAGRRMPDNHPCLTRLTAAMAAETPTRAKLLAAQEAQEIQWQEVLLAGGKLEAILATVTDREAWALSHLTACAEASTVRDNALGK